MTINLTESGWTDQNGNSLGTWTNRADVIVDDDLINVAEDLNVSTRNGDDILESEDFRNFTGINLESDSSLSTGNGRDTISGKGFLGINLQSNSSLSTGNGNDLLNGEGYVRFFLEASTTITTGKGDDNISSEGFASGISNRGTIDTGQGNDSISGIANRDPRNPLSTSGIFNSGTISTGSGNDTILASGKTGLYNRSGTINTGSGNDTIDALTGGFTDFDGTGRINLGEGNDLIQGFGDHQGTIDGGHGYDVAELGFDYNESTVTFGSTSPTSIDIIFNSETASYTNIEAFDFNGQIFSLEQLLA